jgi:putative restriction endonuclease
MATGGKLKDLTQAAAVERAMAEFRALGRDAFIARYGFGRSRDFFVIHEGRAYDSKPLAAAAHGHQQGFRPLESDDFSGGEPVVKTFERLGFHVGEVTSAQLTEGGIYTRQDLRSIFGVTDATINNGFYRPQDTQSIWLFVTGEKSTPELGAVNKFDGDLFIWLGQNAGRTDAQIINHENDGREVLLFHRETKSDHSGGGFVFRGGFRYLSHVPGPPSKFTLQHIDADLESNSPDPSPFDPASIKDGREKVLAEVKRRLGQPKFRRGLLKAYDGRCAVTGCTTAMVLEAAHIHPYRGSETNDVRNGLLLRADIHTLFDLGLIAIDSNNCLAVAASLAESDYSALHTQPLAVPTDPGCRPSVEALKWHFESHSKHDRMS